MRSLRVLVSGILAVGLVSVCSADPLEVRVRQTSAGPRIFVDGKAVPPRWVYPSHSSFFLPADTEPKRHELAFDVAGSNATVLLTFRYNQVQRGKDERATVTLRDLRLEEAATGRIFDLRGHWRAVQKDEWTGTASFGGDGSVVADLRPARETLVYGDFHVVGEVKLSSPGRYRLSFEVLSTSAQPIYPGVLERSDRRNGAIRIGEGDSYDRTVRLAASVGVDFVTPPMPNCWTEPDRPTDWKPLDGAMRHLIDLNPRVIVVPRIGVDAPAWMLKANPEIRMKDEHGVTLSKGSVSSRPYRRAAVAHLEKLARHLRETFPRHFGGIHVCGQNTGEWFYYHSQSDILLGYEDCVREAFRDYLAARGDPGAATAEVPTPSERRTTVAGCFVDPVKTPRLAAFNAFRQEEMASFLNDLGAAVRRGTDGRLLSVFFYGYHCELAGFGAESGHLGLGWLLENGRGNFDAFAGPISYPGRQTWPGVRDVMGPAESLARAGMMWIHEDDTRTYLEPFWDFVTRCGGPKIDKAQTLRTLRRNLAQDIIRGFGCWWMDLFGRGWLADADLWNVQRELRPLERTMLARRAPFTPDVAFIVHEKGLESVVAGRQGLLAPAVAMSRTAFSGAGAPYGQYLLADVLANGLDAKLRYYACACHLTRGERAALAADRLAHPERTRVWVWAPGYVSPEGCDVRQIAETTGFEVENVGRAEPLPIDAVATACGIANGLTASKWPLKHNIPIETLFAVRTNGADEVWATYSDGRPAVVVRRHPEGGSDVFVGPIRVPDAAFVASLERLAGVHRYTRPGEAAVWAAEGHVMVQAFRDGEIEIDFGKAGDVLEMGTGERVAAGPKARIAFGKGDVRIFSQSMVLPRSPNKLQLYALMGRSDMAERDVGTAPPNRYCTLDAAGAWSAGRLACTLGSALVASGPIHFVGVLPCAERGSSPDRWLPGGDLYGAALERLRTGKKRGFPTAFVWLPDDEAPDDPVALARTMAELRKDLGFGDVRVAIGEYGGTSVGEAVAAKLPNAVAVPFVRGDAKGNFERLAAALMGAVDATVTHVVPPIRAFADGRELKVNAARVSAFPMNQEWPGYQRPLDQTAIAYFASFPVDGRSVEFALDIPGGVPQGLRIRPLGVPHATRVENGRLVITVTKPEQFVVECGTGGPQVHVFADPPFRYEHVPDEIYFGPGEHDAGVIAPKSGQTVCIDEGAVVYGTIHCLGVKNVRIVGRGILDASRLHRGDKRSKAYAFCRANGFDTDATARVNCCFTANNSSDVSVEGITMRDSCRWTMLVWRGSSRISFDNIKIIGQWRYCTDGLDVWGCRGVTVRNSFIRSFDDCIVARGVPGRTTGDYLVENSVLWCDWGKNLEIITDGGDCDFENIVFRNNRLVEVNSSGCTLSVMGARAGTFRDILYKDNEVDVCAPRWRNQLQRKPGEAFGFEESRDVAAVNLFATPCKDDRGRDVPAYSDGRRLRLVNVVVDGVKVLGDGLNVTANVRARTDYQDFSGVVLTNLDARIRVTRDLLPHNGAEAGKSDAERMHATEMNAGIPASREILRGGGFRVLVYGNSIAHHRPSAKIGWTNSWGMAASSLDRDFASLTVKGLEERLGKKADYRVKTLYRLECDPRAFEVEKTLADDVAFRPDYVVIAIGENVRSLATDEEKDVYRTRLEEIARMFRKDGRNPKIVYRSPFWRNELKARLTKEAAEATGSLYVDAGPLGDDPANKALGLFAHPGVAGHPGDRGMAALADLILKALAD